MSLVQRKFHPCTSRYCRPYRVSNLWNRM